MTDIPVKRCTKCGEEKPYTNEYFGKDRKKKSGLGSRCIECLRKIGRVIPDTLLKKPRVTSDDYLILAKSKNIFWIGDYLPKTIAHKTNWRCSCGYEWTSSYSWVKRTKHSCLQCYRTSIDRYGEEEYKQLALLKHIEWDGVLPKSTNYKCKWRCSCGHEWGSSYNRISNSNGCPKCAKKRKVPFQPYQYHELAIKNGFEFVGNVPLMRTEKTEWKCQKGHIWSTSYQYINLGFGCPHCIDYVNGVPVSKPQRKIWTIIGGELNYKIGKFRADIVILTPIPICIEYDGYHWHKDKEDRDESRIKSLIESGWRVLRIKAGNKIPSEGQIKTALDQLRNGQSYIEIVLNDWGKR